MRRWIEWLRRGPRLIEELRKERETARDERNRAIREVAECELRANIIERDFKQFLDQERRKASGLGCHFKAGVRAVHSIDTCIQTYRLTLAPEPRCINFVMTDWGDCGDIYSYRRFLSEYLAQQMIAHLRKTLAPEIERQLEKQVVRA